MGGVECSAQFAGGYTGAEILRTDKNNIRTPWKSITIGFLVLFCRSRFSVDFVVLQQRLYPSCNDEWQGPERQRCVCGGVLQFDPVPERSPPSDCDE